MKIAPSGTPHHHNRSHLHHNHTHRDRLPSFHHRCSQGNFLDRSGSSHQPPHDRSSSHHQRQTSHSISHHHGHSWYPSTDMYPRRHSFRDTPNNHRHNTSKYPHDGTTPNTNPLITVGLAPGTINRSHTRKTSKPHSWTETPKHPSTRRSLFRTHSHIPPQNQTTIWILETTRPLFK